MKRAKSPPRLTTRLAFYICALQIVSFVAMFGLSFYVGLSFIESKDRQLLEAKLKEYESVLKASGEEGIRARLAQQKIDHVDQEFYVRLLRPTQNIDIYQLPYDLDDFVVPDVLAELSQLKGVQTSFELHSPQSWDDRFFGYSSEVDSETILQVGKTVEDWEQFTNHLYKSFLKALIPFALLGLLGGFFIARRTLRPVQSMINTMELVGNGATSKRIVVDDVDDEFKSLIEVFNRMLDRIEKLISTMQESLDYVAHDIRTPLTRIRTKVELALRAQPSLETYRSALEECLENSLELSTFATTIMDISEAESGAMKLNLTDVDALTLLNEAVELYEHVAEDRRVLLEVDPRAQNVLFKGDRSRIKQALANLIDNAVKYSEPDSDVCVSIHTTHSLGREESWVTFTVADAGSGIETNELGKVWEKLYRADKSRSLPGIGLGLATVRSIVAAHRGRYDVTSELGKGSTFSISFPV